MDFDILTYTSRKNLAMNLLKDIKLSSEVQSLVMAVIEFNACDKLDVAENMLEALGPALKARHVAIMVDSGTMEAVRNTGREQTALNQILRIVAYCQLLSL